MLAARRVGEAQAVGVEEEPAGPEGALGRPVTGIAHHRMADGRHVDADLVGPPALQAQLDQRRRAGDGRGVPTP